MKNPTRGSGKIRKESCEKILEVFQKVFLLKFQKKTWKNPCGGISRGILTRSRSPPCVSLARVSRFLHGLTYFANNHSEKCSYSSPQAANKNLQHYFLIIIFSYFEQRVKAHVRKNKTLHTRFFFLNLYQQFCNLYGLFFCVDVQVIKFATFYQNLVLLIPSETLTKTLQEVIPRILP